jgi:hypothetical protein
MDILEAKYGNGNFINVKEIIEEYRQKNTIYIPKSTSLSKLFKYDPAIGKRKTLTVLWKLVKNNSIVLNEFCDKIVDKCQYGKKQSVKINIKDLYSYNRTVYKFKITNILYGLDTENCVNCTDILINKLESDKYFIDIDNLEINKLVKDPYVNKEKKLFIYYEETSVFETIIYERSNRLKKDLVIGIDLNEYKLNLIVHIVPKKCEIFSLNMDYLKTIIPSFNNKIVVSIVNGAELEKKDYVQNWIDLKNITVLEKENNIKLGEAVSIRDLLKNVKNNNKNEYTFYCHSKGITRGEGRDPTVAAWTELMYKYCISNIDTMIYQNSYTGGAIRSFDKFPNDTNAPLWHFSGTFFWFNHRLFDTVNIDEKITNDYYTVEMLPGKICDISNSLVFLKDNSKPFYECFLTENKDDIINNLELLETDLAKSVEKIISRY